MNELFYIYLCTQILSKITNNHHCVINGGTEV